MYEVIREHKVVEGGNYFCYNCKKSLKVGDSVLFCNNNKVYFCSIRCEFMLDYCKYVMMVNNIIYHEHVRVNLLQEGSDEV